jgi:hypothetical protein
LYSLDGSTTSLIPNDSEYFIKKTKIQKERKKKKERKKERKK